MFGRSDPVSVAALGKHPGWEDHIKDIPGVPERLLEVERELITEGIGGNIANEAWKKLRDAGKSRDFGHIFLFRTAADFVVGRLWPSSDAKKRQEYPMVVCAQCVGQPLGWVMGRVLARLGTLEEHCRATTSASIVRSSVEQAGQELRAEATGGGGEPAMEDGIVARVAAMPEMAGEGFHRLMYQMEEELAGFMQPDLIERMARRNVETRAQHIRVPACAPTAAAAVELWLGFLLARLDRNAAIAFFIPHGERWLDVIVGAPTPAQIYCLRATTDAVPLATEIPYTIDDAFRARVDAIIAGRAPAARPRVSGPGAAKPGGGRKIAVLAGVATVGIVAVGVGVVMFGGNGGPQPPIDPQPGPGPAVVAKVDPAVEAWCRAWESAGLGAYSPMPVEVRAALSRDAYLEGNLLGKLASLDPRSLLPEADRARPITELLQANPKGWASGAAGEGPATGAARVRAAIDAVRAWPTLARAGELAGEMNAKGWDAAASQVRSIADEVRNRLATQQFPPPARLAAVAAGAVAAAEAASIGERIGAFARAAQEHPELAGVVAAFDRGSRAALAGVSLEALPGVLNEQAEVSERAAAFVESAWDGVEADLFTRGSERHRALSGAGAVASASDIEAWSQEAGGWVALEAAEHPLAAENARLGVAQEAAQARVEEVRTLDASRADGLSRRLAGAMDSLEEARGLAAVRRNRDEIGRRVAAVAAELAAIDAEGGRIAAELGSELWAPIRRQVVEIAALEEVVPGDAAINREWKRLRAMVMGAALTNPDEWRADPDRASARVRVLARYRAELSELAQRMSTAIAGNGIDPRIGGELQARLAQERDRRLAAALDSLAWDGSDITWRNDPREAEVAALAGAVEGAREIAGRLALLRAHLDSGRGLADPIEGGDTAGFVAACREHALVKPPGPTTEALFARVDLLEGLAAAGRSRLADMAKSAGEAPPEVAVEVWRRLGASEWPASREELVIEGAMRGRLTALGWAGDELAVEGARRWSIYMDRAPDAAAIWAGLEARAAMGSPGLEVLSSRARFNAELVLLQRELNGQTKPGAAGRQRVGEFVQAAGAWMAGMEAGHRAAAEVVCRALTEADADRDDVPPPPPPGIGPAGAGWTQLPGTNDSVVQFEIRLRGNTHRLTFVRLEPSGSPAAFVCTEELSVGLLADVVQERRASGAIGPLLEYPPGGRDKRPGPRSWEWTGDKAMAVARSWLELSPGVAIPEATFEPASPPGREMPAQHLSPTGSMFVGVLVGCRLATSAEWKAALEFERRGATLENLAQSATANLLDAKWLAQAQYAANRSKPSPVNGRYAGEDAANTPALGASYDDGVIYFRPVSEGPGTFKNILGNVGEFVFDNAAAADAIDGKKGMAEVQRAVQALGVNGWGVVGGSAFSPGGKALDVVVPLDSGSIGDKFGYSDAGVRLAFSAPRPVVVAGPERAPLARVLREAVVVGP